MAYITGAVWSERNDMTIAIGLSCDEGVVLAADTQITVEGLYKDSETKF
jgi:20S proteasome alpha/beta subunit